MMLTNMAGRTYNIGRIGSPDFVAVSGEKVDRVEIFGDDQPTEKGFLRFEFGLTVPIGELKVFSNNIGFIHSVKIDHKAPKAERLAIELYVGTELLTRGKGGLVFKQPLSRNSILSPLRYKIVPLDGAQIRGRTVELVFSVTHIDPVVEVQVPKCRYNRLKLLKGIPHTVDEPHIVEVDNGDRLLVADSCVTRYTK